MRRQLGTAGAIALLLTGLVAGCSKSEAGPGPALNDFLDLWAHGKADKAIVQYADGTALPDTQLVAKIKALSGDLSPAQATFKHADPTVKDNDATATVDVSWQLAENVSWTYKTNVALKKVDKQWRVIWAPSVIHPQLKDGDSFKTEALAAQRGNLLDGAGQPIVMPRPVVEVGLQPSQVTNATAVIGALDAAFKSIGEAVDLSDLPAQLTAADPDAFVSVVTLRRDRYDKIRDQIHELPGTVFHETNLALAPSRSFARALIGTVGDVTKEQLDKHPGKYVVGDQVGQSGLEEQYDSLMRGTTGLSVSIAQPKNDNGTAEADIPLFKSDPRNGEPLKTTLDQKVENAAEAALAPITQRSAIVAIRISDGSILAAANGPNGGEVNLAFTASVPPGSTFKMITALGVLDNGSVTPDTIVDCPKTYTVDGRSFNNAGNFELGAVPLHVDFARSCNTAFASLAPKLAPDGLRKTSATVGIGIPWNLGTDVFTGTVPANVSNVEQAAAAFGQGQTVVSPVAMAGAAAAVARGTWSQPKLFTEVPKAAPGASPGPSAPNSVTLNPTSAAGVRAMMREVATSGTAAAMLGNVPGDPIYVKTGTAEFADNSPDAHAWVIGWRGDIAFAVFVEKGVVSSITLPVILSFFAAL